LILLFWFLEWSLPLREILTLCVWKESKEANGISWNVVWSGRIWLLTPLVFLASDDQI
jgi:hypothetical protein